MNRMQHWHEDLRGLQSWVAYLATWLFTKPGRHFICWVGAVCLGSSILFTAWKANGHITCDFAGQWLMGRMFCKGMGQDLYLSAPQREVFAEGYRVGDAALREQVKEIKDDTIRNPLQEKIDEPYIRMVKDILEKNHSNFVVEGALYPPTAGLLFWPFALMPPQASHAVIVFLHFLLAILNGWFISRITRQRVQWGEAVLIIFACPNCFQAFLLGQNSMFSLTFLCAGWYCLHRNWPFVGGLVWALFAYKPVFALSLLLVPVLLPNRRMLAGMVIGGILYCAATLPFVGTVGLDRLVTRMWERSDPSQNLPADAPTGEAAHMNPWERWLLVGKNAGHIYSYDANWVWMSRDLVGLPRRRMWDQEGMWHTWNYLYQRYIYGIDLWYRPEPAMHAEKQRLEAERLRQFSEDWPEDRKQAWREEHQRWSHAYDDEILRCARKWEADKNKAHEDHQQKTYDPSRGFAEQAEQATLAGAVLLCGFLLITALVGAATYWLPQRKGLPPPPQAEGNRSAFLLFGGIMGCWHFMHYDLIMCALPICMMLAEFTKRSWPRFPGPVIALAVLAVVPAVLGFLVLHGAWGWSLPGPWWLRGTLAVQLAVGVASLAMLLLYRRPSWLLVTTVVLLVLTVEVVLGIGMEFGGWSKEEMEPALGGLVIGLPLLVMLMLLGGRLWLWLLTALFLLCNWDMTYSGIVRFPFETILVLAFWNWSGCLALKEMWDRPSTLTPPVENVIVEGGANAARP